MDPYLRLLAGDALPGRVSRGLARRLGLPTPVELRRYSPGDPLVPGPVQVGGTDGRLLTHAVAASTALGADLPELEPSTDARPHAVLFDASGITDSAGLAAAYAFLHPRIRRIDTCGRLLVLGSDPDHCTNPGEATAQSALTGLVRSAAKEIGRGGTANLLRVAPGAEQALGGPIGFLLSAKSAYVSGQVLDVRTPFLDPPENANPTKPLVERTILVTGAARGIGEQIARTLARDGGTVICLDHPEQTGSLRAVADSIGGILFPLDITADDSAAVLATYLDQEHGGVHAVVHNAGVLRDRTLARMTTEEWDTVLAVNLVAQERLDAAILERGAMRGGGRLVSIASVSGIAGNRGQTNYATSKAGVIGRVHALSECSRTSTVNAVAPGFIETAMTRSMPVLAREVGRRANSLGQGGLPVDVAEVVAFLVSPGAYAVDGNVIRVCGQSMLGA